MHAVVTTFIVSSVTGAIGYYLKYFLDRKQALTSASANLKRQMYSEYIETLVGFYQRPPTNDPVAQAVITEKFRKDTERFQNKYVLDASPSVIRAIKKQHIYFQKNQHRQVDGRIAGRKNARIFRAMRRDIGTTNWTLGPSAALLLEPLLMYNYERDMHPLIWHLKKLIHRKFGPIHSKAESMLSGIKVALYRWTDAEAKTEKQADSSAKQ